MKSDFILTFTSPDRPGVIEDLTQFVVDCGGNWEESRSARLCGDFAGIARVSIEEDSIAKFEQGLGEFQTKGIVAQARKNTPQPEQGEATSGALICSGADHEGIVSGVASRLAAMGVNVEEMETTVLAAPTTGTPLFQMQCQLTLPSDCDLEQLRSQLQVLEQDLAVEIELLDAESAF
ncbi:MAG: ACT domain-containing protein [Planctomycetota bacterium]|nr:ACT domain-containing protein [Planctomycetota bacterium]